MLTKQQSINESQMMTFVLMLHCVRFVFLNQNESDL